MRVRIWKTISDYFDDRDDIERDLQGRRMQAVNTSPVNLVRNALPGLAVLLVVVGTYLCVGASVYTSTSVGMGWTVVDSVYFSMVTMSTVGYGDLSPEGVGLQVFTIVMIFVGIAFVFRSLSHMMGRLTGPLTARGRVWLEVFLPEEHVDIDGDGEADYCLPRHAMVFYPKNLLPSLLLNITLQCASAAVFVALEPDMSYWSAMYNCIVTATVRG